MAPQSLFGDSGIPTMPKLFLLDIRFSLLTYEAEVSKAWASVPTLSDKDLILE